MCEFLVPLFDLFLIDLRLWLMECWLFDECGLSIAGEFANDVKEWLFEVVVTLRADVVVLQILLAVELNVLRLDLAVFAVDLVAAQN